MRKHMHILIFALYTVSHSHVSVAQEMIGRDEYDTLEKEIPANVPAGNSFASSPRSYNSLIKPNSVTRKGLFYIHRVNDNYYFEVPDSLLGRDLLVVSRISRGAAGIRHSYTGYSGDQINNTVVRFEKGPGHRIFLRRISYDDHAGDSTAAMYQAVVRSNLQPLVASFGVGAYHPNGKSSVFDVTDFINGDNDVFFFNSSSRQTMKVGGIQSNMCYIQDVNAYPTNVEIRTIKTYAQLYDDKNFTLELNTSIVLLPKNPMRKRYADSRVGFFSERYIDYETNPHGVKVIRYIKKWRLEPKPEDVERYLNGELVEPAKPIVFYIDPATPKKWVPYLIHGVTDWQVAFECAGFKNAIVAREAHEAKDASWSLQDARHSAIVYKPSALANAAGPSVTDPRSGEILESHINWYHNLMSILCEWYMIQCGPLDLRAQRMKFDDHLMGQLIRSVASHEVGHTLGLAHNFGSSSTVPVEKLRDRAWLAEHGHTPSIMDYSRFNYVAQPEDSVGELGLISRIGAYDKWAIEWGYRWFPDASPESEIPLLNKWVMEKSKQDNLWYGSEFSGTDPRVQTEDLGDNAMLANEYGIKNLKRVVPNLILWSYQPHEGYWGLQQMYQGTLRQYENYLDQVVTNIGGIYQNNKSMEQKGPVFEVVPRETQLQALDFVVRHSFHAPTWLLDTAVLNRIGMAPMEIVANLQEHMLDKLLDEERLQSLSSQSAMYGSNAYSLLHFLRDVDDAIWLELRTHDHIDPYRRNLQNMYVDRLIEIEKTARSGKSRGDAGAIVRQLLKDIHSRISKGVSKGGDELTVYHLRFLLEKMEAFK